MYNLSTAGSPIKIINSTIAANGGGIYNYLTSLIITNSIIWANSDGNGSFYNTSGSNYAITSSLVEGGYSGTGNIDADPMFLDAVNGDLHLKPSSPAINKGDNAANTATTDLDSKPRIYGNIVDMGAYEFQCAPITISSHPQNASACSGGSATFTVGVTGSDLTYKWYKDGQSARSSNNSPTLTINNALSSDAGSYTVDVIGDCGTVTSNAAVLTVNSASTPVVTVTNNCGNSTLSTTATGSLLWSTGETSSSINVNKAGTYTVTQTINGCTSDAGSGTAAPNAAPSKPVITANGSTNFCQGGSVVLSAPSGFRSYLWSNNATTPNITVTASDSYSVVVTNAAGCSSPASDAITIEANNDTQKPVITCPQAVTFCYDASQTYTIASLQAADNCGIASIAYTIKGTTCRNGNGNNASGKFNPGTSTITWTVKDGNGNTSTCQSNVTVNEKFTVSIPDGHALGSGCEANTVYKGYTPASYILLIAKPAGGKSPYTYKWSNGSTASFILISPASTTTYTVIVKDSKGCTQSASKRINVVDISCGSKMDKVSICHKGNTLCISKDDVADHLLHGDYLGNCKGKTASRELNEMVEKEVKEENDLSVKASPNPAANFFTITAKSNDFTNKIRMTIIDEVGRPVETITMNAGQTIQLGDNYRPGVYFAQAL